MDATPGEWQIRFRRQFVLPELVEWDNLCREVQGLPLGDHEDTISWSLEPLGVYSNRSMYLSLSQGATVTCFKDLWKTRVPPKIKNFLWQLIRSRVSASVWACPMAYALYVGTWRTTTSSLLACLDNLCGPRFRIPYTMIGTLLGLFNSL
jgi:hypothetical protein